MHTVRAVNAAIPYLEKSRAPSIVIISSVSGREIDFTGPAYGAIKAALIHYAQRLAFQYAPKNIRVNSVSPGNTYFEGGVWHWIEGNLPDLYNKALGAQSDGPHGDAAGSRARHRLPRKPRFGLHHRHQSGDRRRADPRRAVLAPSQSGRRIRQASVTVAYSL